VRRSSVAQTSHFPLIPCDKETIMKGMLGSCDLLTFGCSRPRTSSTMVVAPTQLSGRNEPTESMMDSARVGLDYIVENGDYVEKLASGKKDSLSLSHSFSLSIIHSVSTRLRTTTHAREKKTAYLTPLLW